MSFGRVEERLTRAMPNADAVEYLLGKPITPETAPTILSELEAHLEEIGAAVGALRDECAKMEKDCPNRKRRESRH